MIIFLLHTGVLHIRFSLCVAEDDFSARLQHAHMCVAFPFLQKTERRQRKEEKVGDKAEKLNALIKAEAHFLSHVDVFLLLLTLDSACTPYRIISEVDFSI